MGYSYNTLKKLLIKKEAVRIFVLFLMLSVTLHAEKTPITPPLLKKGDVVAIVAPASCPDEDQMFVNRAINALIQKGYRVRTASNIMTRNGYLAGTDYDRAKEFMNAWLDPEVKAVWCYRGGYGCARILERLDYQAIQQHPKILIGMSDITALHAAIAKETGLVTFLGPNFNEVFGDSAKKTSAFTEQQLWNTITKATPINKGGYRFPIPKSFPGKQHPVMTINGGVARGRLTGGTLSLVASLIGTPWEIDTAGKILVLEEVDEEPYCIDRMLRQLKLAGLLDNPAGVILCSWKGCSGKRPNKTLALEHIFKEYFAHTRYPVLFGFPSGHISDQLTLPLNAIAELDATNKALYLLESPVEVR
ncbi:MAG: putative murein peptide carboxypeptidase [Chlamydiae bacterium]|nr:putative murein peptide carboxypeptidase [Chlamydiota bacterium]